LVFVPNAFTPGGLNPIFQPVLTNVSIENYEFKIMDRWGQLVFETNDKSVGWDGIVKNSGKIASNDTFLYIIKYDNIDNQSVIKRGYVSLLK
jgi:gliding motility-associated-like protein